MTRQPTLMSAGPTVKAGASKGWLGLVLVAWQLHAAENRPWQRGPHLFLDRSLAAATDGLQREVCPPSRWPDPIVTGYEDGCFQPYLTVVRDAQTRRFRMWYGTPRTPQNASESSLAYLESDDGIHWLRPHRVLADPAPIQFGASVIDEGTEFRPAAQRFKLAWWKAGGTHVAGSADGLAWKPLAPGVVLSANHDITSIHWDPIRHRYLGLVSIVPDQGPWKGRRIPHQSVSDDLLHWQPPWLIVQPDPTAPIEQGETQFYGMSAVLARGDLLISLVKVLRDDQNCEPDLTAAQLHDPGRPFAGIGYTVVAWSRDGEHWERETTPLLDRNPRPGTWDRAMAWADDQLIVGDFIYIYYGGYRRGHKAERFTERQIGVAHMPRDRYVAYGAGPAEGRLRTPLRLIQGTVQMTVNAQIDPHSGELRVRVLNDRGDPVSGFDGTDCTPVKGDRVAHPIAWRGDNADLSGHSVQFEFAIKHGRLFAFDLND